MISVLMFRCALSYHVMLCPVLSCPVQYCNVLYCPTLILSYPLSVCQVVYEDNDMEDLTYEDILEAIW
jgi:hypothetical protein